jgi:ComF family protein
MKFPVVSELWAGAVHLFYPVVCEGCNKPLVGGEQVLCLSCSEALPETKYHADEQNESVLRFAGRIPFVHATSLAHFTTDGLLQHLMHGLKYGGKQDIGIYLGKRLGSAIAQARPMPGGKEWITNIDMIIPVPLHKKKMESRGYNQSMLIAQGMGIAMGIEANEQVLERVRETESQTKKTRPERLNNMEAAFKIKNGADLAGKHVLLCDDVLTTGATLEACALALLKEESIKISIATIGIAVS